MFKNNYLPAMDRIISVSSPFDASLTQRKIAYHQFPLKSCYYSEPYVLKSYIIFLIFLVFISQHYLESSSSSTGFTSISILLRSDWHRNSAAHILRAGFPTAHILRAGFPITITIDVKGDKRFNGLC